MKFDRRLPSHWLRAAWLVSVIALACLIAWLLPRKRPGAIVLSGHALNGNLLALSQAGDTADARVKWFYAAMSASTVPSANRVDILRLWRLRDALKLARASTVVTDHGPGILVVLQVLRPQIAFVDVWHGVGFKALGSSYGAKMARYHSVIASSPWDAENQVHTAGMGDHQVEPLGYCLMDTIVAAQRSPSGTEYQSRPKLLVAPTWSHGVTDNFDELAGQRVVNALGTWADTRGWDIVIRAHLNASAGFQIADNVRFMPMESFSDTVSLMIESDVLVTDWSSIATDFYGLGRPVVFWDRPCPFDALRMTPEDRAGPIVDSVDELVAVLDVIASDSDWFSAKYGSRQRELVERFHGSGLDGGAGARVVEFLSAVAFV